MRIKTCMWLLSITAVIIVLIFIYSIFAVQKGNENTQIILYNGSGEEIVYENPDWYKFRKSGITFEKDGIQYIAGTNYEVRIKVDE